jgi:hypothetical protein
MQPYFATGKPEFQVLPTQDDLRILCPLPGESGDELDVVQFVAPVIAQDMAGTQGMTSTLGVRPSRCMPSLPTGATSNNASSVPAFARCSAANLPLKGSSGPPPILINTNVTPFPYSLRSITVHDPRCPTGKRSDVPWRFP